MVGWIYRRGLSRVLIDLYDQIFFLVRAAWHPYSESVQTPQVEWNSGGKSCYD